MNETLANTTRRWARALLCGALIAACSGAIDDNLDTSEGFAQSYCALFTDCCEREHIARTKPSCETMTQGRMQGRPYDAKQGRACVAAMRAQASRDDFCSTAGDYVARAACDPVLMPTKYGSAQPGAACATQTDCAQSPGAIEVGCFGDANGAPSGTTPPSTCVVELVGKVGDAPCIGTIAGTSAGFSWSARASVPAKAYVCDPANGAICDLEQRCVAIGQPGAPAPMTPAQSSDIYSLCGR